jgi:hypothetical protein
MCHLQRVATNRQQEHAGREEGNQNTVRQDFI